MEPLLQAAMAAIASFSTISLLFLLIHIFTRSNPSKPPTPPPTTPPPSNTLSFRPSLLHIPLSDLAAATKNFSPDRILGDGAFGFVYKAFLPSGLPAAVKRLSPDLPPSRGRREFRAEIETLARLRHPNLARLLGYCARGPDRLLVYEFLPGGSLDSRLHDRGTLPPLAWRARARILREVAEGLAFLHVSCSPSIVHRDIKASNVLLDGESVARIADFGLARLVGEGRSHASTQEAGGTAGYVAPEYGEGGAATAKGDVYSFGVLAMEVVTGRRPSWPVRRGGGGGEVGMVEWARGEVEAGRGMEILDGLMMGKEEAAESEVMAVLGVAYRSTEERPGRRPCIAQVVKLLDGF